MVRSIAAWVQWKWSFYAIFTRDIFVVWNLTLYNYNTSWYFPKPPTKQYGRLSAHAMKHLRPGPARLKLLLSEFPLFLCMWMRMAYGIICSKPLEVSLFAKLHLTFLYWKRSEHEMIEEQGALNCIAMWIQNVSFWLTWLLGDDLGPRYMWKSPLNTEYAHSWIEKTASWSYVVGCDQSQWLVAMRIPSSMSCYRLSSIFRYSLKHHSSFIHQI